MDCAVVRNHLDAYVDGELEPSPVIELETHLHACEPCRDELGVTQHIKQGVQSLPRTELPDGARERMLRALDRADRGESREESRGEGRSQARFEPGRFEPRRSAAMGMIAVAAVVLLGVVATYRPSAPPVSAPTAVSPSSGLLNTVVSRHLDGLPADFKTSDFPMAQQPDRLSRSLSGQVGFRVRPLEFGQADVRLVGARVTNVGGAPAARLDYSAAGSRLTVLVFQPSAEAQRLLHDDDALRRAGGRRSQVGPLTVTTFRGVRGYAVPMLEHNGLAYAVTSDLDEASVLRLLATARLP